MPRRNSPKPLPNYFDSRGLSNTEIETELHRRRERTERRIDERVAKAVDPSVCCIPGCETALWRPDSRLGILRSASPDPRVDEQLPLCPRHLTIIAKQAERRWQDPDIETARAKYADQFVHREIKRERDWERQWQNAGAEGQIYVVRQNGLIKVGWSSKLRSRLKQYGANVEILCHFPATRADETNLHRQLRPYLAQGREWYEDCQLIHDVVAGYVKQYGEPTLQAHWTKPKPPVIKKRKAG